MVWAKPYLTVKLITKKDYISQLEDLFKTWEQNSNNKLVELMRGLLLLSVGEMRLTNLIKVTDL